MCSHHRIIAATAAEAGAGPACANSTECASSSPSGNCAKQPPPTRHTCLKTNQNEQKQKGPKRIKNE
eukprot:1193448-Prorocentrum_minimum.AAC.3